MTKVTNNDIVIYVIFSELNMILKMAFTAIIFTILTAIIILIIHARIEENENYTIFLTPDMINETVLIQRNNVNFNLCQTKTSKLNSKKSKNGQSNKQILISTNCKYRYLQIVSKSP